MPMKPIRMRKPPKPGVVVRFKMSENRHAYFCAIDEEYVWLYDFVTDHPTKSVRYFSPERWKRPLSIVYMTTDFVDVIKLKLNADQLTLPKLYRYATSASLGTPVSAKMKGKPLASGFYLLMAKQPRPDFPSEPKEIRTIIVSEEETSGAYPLCMVGGAAMAHWLSKLDPPLKLIRISPEDRDLKALDEQPLSAKKDDIDNPPLLEIQFPWQNEGLARQRFEIEDELLDQLEERGCGTIIGGGVMSGLVTKPDEAAFDLAVEVTPGRLKGALRIIRKVLKQFNAPPGTVIRECRFADTAPIEHPLEPPKK